MENNFGKNHSSVFPSLLDREGHHSWLANFEMAMGCTTFRAKKGLLAPIANISISPPQRQNEVATTQRASITKW